MKTRRAFPYLYAAAAVMAIVLAVLYFGEGKHGLAIVWLVIGFLNFLNLLLV